jgi:hypothetical protein
VFVFDFPGVCVSVFFVSRVQDNCVTVFLINRRLYMCVFICVCAFYDIQSALFISRCLSVFPGSGTTV